MSSLPSIPAPYHIAGVQLHPVGLDMLCRWMMNTIAQQQQALVLNVNAHAINLAQHHAPFRAVLNRADVVFCDGQGVRLAARWLGYHIPERFTPPDWIDRLASLCQQQGYRLFFLGAAPGVAQAAATTLQARHPGLSIATHDGFFDTTENQAICDMINAAGTHLLLVGMGMPRQELWLAEQLPQLRVPLAMSVGALFDYLAGTVPRGPRWLTDHGLEWLCRLWYEPRRLWRRYLIGNLRFAWTILRARQRNHRKGTAAS